MDCRCNVMRSHQKYFHLKVTSSPLTKWYSPLHITTSLIIVVIEILQVVYMARQILVKIVMHLFSMYFYNSRGIL